MNQSLMEFDKMVLNKKATWWKMSLPSGSVIFGSAKAEMLGYPEDNFVVYQDFTKLLHPDDFDNAMQAMNDHLSGKKDVYETIYRIKTKDGEYIKFYDCGKIVKKEGKEISLMGLVFKVSGDQELEKFKEIVFEGDQNLLDLVGRVIN